MNETFIVDLGSGNTCKNDAHYTKKMIDELAKVDKDKKIILKWQLFKEAGENLPLKQTIFHLAYIHAEDLGFKTTASVFDLESLNFLLRFDIPFVKIANRDNLNYLIEEVPRKIKIIKSESNKELIINYDKNIDKICCVSEYPAIDEQYLYRFGTHLYMGISDHTANWNLYKKFTPKIYECHYKLKDSTGLDAGEWARTSEQLKEIL